MKTYKGVNLNLLSACCHCSCCYQMLHREPMGKKAYRFSLHELGVMVMRMDVNVKITVLHKGQGLYYQLNGSSNLELVHWKKKLNKHLRKKWMNVTFHQPSRNRWCNRGQHCTMTLYQQWRKETSVTGRRSNSRRAGYLIPFLYL